MRLLIQITVELVLAGVLASLGVWMIGSFTGVTQIIGVVLLLAGIAVGVHLVLAAAFGKLKTPASFGAGFTVPESSRDDND